MTMRTIRMSGALSTRSASTGSRTRATHSFLGRACAGLMLRVVLSGDGRVSDATSLVAGKSEEELEDELPWQLIALLDAAITRDLLRSHAWREHKVERARTGQDLPRLAAASLEAIAAEEEEAGWLYRAGPEGAELFAAPDGRRRGSLAPNRYARIVEKEGDWLRRADGKWLRAADVGGRSRTRRRRRAAGRRDAMPDEATSHVAGARL